MAKSWACKQDCQDGPDLCLKVSNQIKTLNKQCRLKDF